MICSQKRNAFLERKDVWWDRSACIRGAPMGGKITFVFKFCFGPKTVPKGPFGVGMGPIGTKNYKESESGLKKTKFLKTNKHFENWFFETFQQLPPHLENPPSALFWKKNVQPCCWASSLTRLHVCLGPSRWTGSLTRLSLVLVAEGPTANDVLTLFLLEARRWGAI